MDCSILPPKNLFFELMGKGPSGRSLWSDYRFSPMIHGQQNEKLRILSGPRWNIWRTVRIPSIIEAPISHRLLSISSMQTDQRLYYPYWARPLICNYFWKLMMCAGASSIADQLMTTSHQSDHHHLIAHLDLFHPTRHRLRDDNHHHLHRSKLQLWPVVRKRVSERKALI